MRTLDLTEAAKFLFCHEDTVLRLVAEGVLPGTKIGRKLVFVDVDLIEAIRAQYQTAKQPTRKQCRSTNAARRGGSISVTTARGFDDLLGLPTSAKPKESTTNLKRNSGKVVQMHTPGEKP